MVKDTYIDKLPQGPWLSDEEIEAILCTDADEEFDRIMATRRNRWTVRRLWPVGVAASVALAVLGGMYALMDEPGVEPVITSRQARVAPKPSDIQEAESAVTSSTPPATVAKQRVNKCTASTVLVTEQPDPCVEDILMEADMAFDRAARVCEGMIVAADCEFETEEDDNDAMVIYI